MHGNCQIDEQAWPIGLRRENFNESLQINEKSQILTVTQFGTASKVQAIAAEPASALLRGNMSPLGYVNRTILIVCDPETGDCCRAPICNSKPASKHNCLIQKYSASIASPYSTRRRVGLS
jgi:hypothetical protein